MINLLSAHWINKRTGEPSTNKLHANLALWVAHGVVIGTAWAGTLDALLFVAYGAIVIGNRVAQTALERGMSGNVPGDVPGGDV